MTNLPIDIVLVALVALFAGSRLGRRRVLNRSTSAGRTVATLDQPPESDDVETTAPATGPWGVETPMESLAYILSARHAGGRGDAMAETLAMMTGSGICTPHSAQP